MDSSPELIPPLPPSLPRALLQTAEESVPFARGAGKTSEGKRDGRKEVLVRDGKYNPRERWMTNERKNEER